MGTVSAGLSGGLAGQAMAQATAPSAATTPAPAPPGGKADKSGTTTTVTVTGKKPSNRIDRQVYDVTKNPDADTGTAADALNKVPGVNVDPSGNVTLHGRNAVVYLNGRPSLMLSGDNRGIALQSMPSAYISSIEVISNPGAQYSSSNSSPIINIVTKRNMPPGYFGSLSAQLRSDGGGLGSGYFMATQGKLSFTFSGTDNVGRNPARSAADSTALDGGGAVTQASRSAGRSLSRYGAPYVMANLQYDMDTNNVVAGGLTYSHASGNSTSLSDTTSTGAGGALANVFTGADDGTFTDGTSDLAVTYTHYGKQPDEKLEVDGSLEQKSWQNIFLNDDSYSYSDIAANTGTRVEANDRATSEHKTALHSEYNTPVGDDQLTVGGEVDADDKSSDALASGPDALGADLTPNPLLTDDFRSHQVVSALYGTYQRELTSRWTILGGLRGEATDLSTDDLTYGTRSQARYVRLNPSAYATYVLSGTQKLRFSYTHRQTLPEAADLNPHIVYTSDSSVNAGNPGLTPQETESFEARYEYDSQGLSYAFRGFYRRDYRMIVPTSEVIPDPQDAGNFVTETTHVNWRHQTADGLTATASDQITGKLMLNADATVTFDDIRNPQVSGVQSGTALDGSVSLNYFRHNGDQLYFQYKLIGKRFTGEGYTAGYGQGTIQYNRKLTSKLSLVATVWDPFRQAKRLTVIDTPLLHSRFVNSQQAPTFMIGLSRRFTSFRPAPAKTH